MDSNDFGFSILHFGLAAAEIVEANPELRAPISSQASCRRSGGDEESHKCHIPRARLFAPVGTTRPARVFRPTVTLLVVQILAFVLAASICLTWPGYSLEARGAVDEIARDEPLQYFSRLHRYSEITVATWRWRRPRRDDDNSRHKGSICQESTNPLR